VAINDEGEKWETTIFETTVKLMLLDVSHEGEFESEKS
jgi:hypothetical protein